MATITYFQKYVNKETGITAFIREQVLEIGGEFFGCRERDYGHGAGAVTSKLTKGYKTPARAEKALAKIQASRPNSEAVVSRMQNSHWSK